MFCKLSESVNVNKNRVEPYTGVSSSDSKLTNPKRYVQTSHKKRSRRRNSLNKLLAYYTRAQNERYALTNDEVKLLSRGLKFIPTPPVPSSNKPLSQDFDHFARTMRLKYMFAKERKTSAHPFHVKSTWQPPVQNSVALENYLEETKLEIASAIFRPQIDNISANERKAISALNRNSKTNLKKAEKGTTTVILDTAQKIDEGLQQLSNDKFYKPLSSPIVHDTAPKVKELGPVVQKPINANPRLKINQGVYFPTPKWYSTLIFGKTLH